MYRKRVNAFFDNGGEKTLKVKNAVQIAEKVKIIKEELAAERKAEQERLAEERRLERERKAEEARIKAEEARIKAQKKREGVRVGMTEQDVLDSSWGKPDDINRTTTVYGTSEQWVYKSANFDHSYLYFEDGILTSIQN